MQNVGFTLLVLLFFFLEILNKKQEKTENDH